MKAPFVFQRGGPIWLDLVVSAAGGYDPATLNVSMDMKQAVNYGPPPKSTPALASFAISFVPAAGDAPAYWRASLEASMEPGLYTTDAVVARAGTTLLVTDYVLIKIAETVTPK